MSVDLHMLLCNQRHPISHFSISVQLNRVAVLVSCGFCSCPVGGVADTSSIFIYGRGGPTHSTQAPHTNSRSCSGKNSRLRNRSDCWKA